jgi:hypothetical protein
MCSPNPNLFMPNCCKYNTVIQLLYKSLLLQVYYNRNHRKGSILKAWHTYSETLQKA